MLPFSISLQARLPIHNQVVYAVTRAIVAAQLRPGDSFPSVRALSQELRINPNTAHKIVTTLIDDGLLTVRPGIGTVVSDARRLDVRAGRLQLEEHAERLVIDARRTGRSLQDVIATIRKHWARIVRRAG